MKFLLTQQLNYNLKVFNLNFDITCHYEMNESKYCFKADSEMWKQAWYFKDH